MIFRGSIRSGFVLLLCLLTTLVAVAQDRPSGWTDATHSRSASPNYDVVFPPDRVNRMDIQISPDNWRAMMDDMTASYGEFGTVDMMRLFKTMFPEGLPKELLRLPRIQIPGLGGNSTPEPEPDISEMMMNVNLDFTPQNPIWVESTILFNGHVWEHAGIRFKGNSTLVMSWTNGLLKMPFKLDFDEFEDMYPEIKNQRFYGFKQLSLNNNLSDSSYLRERILTDFFREAGIPAARTAFYEVYLDNGEGPMYLGLYTLIEVVDDTVIQTYFGGNDGNIYEAEQGGSSLAADMFDQIRTGYSKENNSKADDWSDLERLYDILHDDLRLSDPEAWRTQLEFVFNVDVFLTWLAANTILQNWDAYGRVPHNYYLYHDPNSGQLTWIPWDHNEAMKKPLGTGDTMRNSLQLDMNDVSEQWPLIRYLMDDEVFAARYYEAVKASFDVLDVDALTAKYQYLHNLIKPYVEREDVPPVIFMGIEVDEVPFEASVGELSEFTAEQYDLVREFLGR